ncbi:DUF4167 domain-containing protein [Rhodovulum strictum]|uniref:DUF4167 domain-containing protein n=1 Tax=Rhodovulum strictum TaxID=58314 RepID=A0A844B9V6_9RHOB|nr:DUF4167 domain-containing protein [Rhodovulum strictum]MRH19469.1 DUF4167 domain-containing protein [Rhodovulum strictum]
MRPSKSRSRSKSNRQRSMGNIVNRVFDSSGPEGKVRGTPQQIIEKYNQLARDAQLGNDRVAAENFQQHAEHYTRLLGEAMREQDARREQHEAQQGRDRGREDRTDDRPEGEHQPRRDMMADEPAYHQVNGAAEVIELDDTDEGESTLVDTPEERPVETAEDRPVAERPAEKPRRPRKPRAPKPREDGESPAQQAPAAE